MPQPKKRHSNSRQGKRRASNYQLELMQIARCPECNGPIRSHHACLNCGSYKGKKVVKIKQKKEKGKK
jgi:large subunit ribosomal protein L32